MLLVQCLNITTRSWDQSIQIYISSRKQDNKADWLYFEDGSLKRKLIWIFIGILINILYHQCLAKSFENSRVCQIELNHQTFRCGSITKASCITPIMYRQSQLPLHRSKRSAVNLVWHWNALSVLTGRLFPADGDKFLRTLLGLLTFLTHKTNLLTYLHSHFVPSRFTTLSLPTISCLFFSTDPQGSVNRGMKLEPWGSTQH